MGGRLLACEKMADGRFYCFHTTYDGKDMLKESEALAIQRSLSSTTNAKGVAPSPAPATAPAPAALAPVGAPATLTGFDNITRFIVNRTLDSVSDHKSHCDKLFLAWRMLYIQRGTIPGLSNELHFAAAEHYMFARWAVCSGQVGRTTMAIAAIGYDWKKWLGEQCDKMKAATGNHSPTSGPPPSPANEDVKRWGIDGAFMGEIDRKKYYPEPR